jgi:isochorismate hydrolase
MKTGGAPFPKWIDLNSHEEIAKEIKAYWLGSPLHFGENMEFGFPPDPSRAYFFVTELGMRQLYFVSIFRETIELMANFSNLESKLEDLQTEENLQIISGENL